MAIPVLTFFNNKGGVGKTSLVYHLSSMFSELGMRVLAVDLDPQANLTAAFMNEDDLADIWETRSSVATIFDSVKKLLDVGDFEPVAYQNISSNLALIPGDLALSGFEDELSGTWTAVNADKNKTRPFRILTAFWRSAQEAAVRFGAELIVIDVGPNLGAINRAALLSSNHVVVPLGADLFSLQGLRNLGPTLREWRQGWIRRRDGWEYPEFELPEGDMKPLGYVAMRHGVRLTRPVKAYTRWLDRIPAEFRSSVLAASPNEQTVPTIDRDSYCLSMLKNYHSLIPLAQEARKPIFSLRAADGAIGAHFTATQEAYNDFKSLALDIGRRMDLAIPTI
jgi:chromosome partitioning protein